MNQNLVFKNYRPPHLRQLTPLFLIIFIDSLAYFIVIPVLLRLFINDNFSILPPHTSIAERDVLYGIAVALSTLAFLITAPIVGYFSDRYGRKKTLVFCLSAALAGFVLPVIGIVKHYLSLIFIGRFIAGASTSSQPVAQAAITDFSKGKRKAFFLSLIAFAMTLAMVLGPMAGGFLSNSKIYPWFNVTTPYLAGVALALLNIFFLLLLYRDDGQIKAVESKLPLSQRLKQLKGLLLNQRIYFLLLVFLFLELAWSQYYQSIFLILKQLYHYSMDDIGLFAGMIGLWMSLGLTVFYRIMIRFISVSKILWISLILSSIGLLICNYIRIPIVQWVGVIPVSIFVGTAYPSILAMMSNRTSETHQGWVLGSASTALGFAWMVTGFISGFLINLYIALPIMFATLFIFIAMALLTLFAFGSKSKITCDTAVPIQQ